MSKLIPGNQKHLTLNDRLYIEASLNDGLSFRSISKYLCKDPTTISKEVRLHRSMNTWNRGSFDNPANFCVRRFRCRKKNACGKLFICDRYCRSCPKCNQVCKDFERETCGRLNRAPFVCNGCGKPRNRCQITAKYEYDARFAQRRYEETLSSSRQGVNMTRAQCLRMDKVVAPLIKNGQSPYMVVANHPELNVSVKTLYNYIDNGILTVRNVDLKRKVRFKPRKSHKTQIVRREIFVGRTHDDFKALSLAPGGFVEMDTVMSSKDSLKCILTFYMPDTELLIARLMNRCTPGAVRSAFDQLERSLGGPCEFMSVFPYILTDRGREFDNPDRLEASSTGIRRTKVYYCDPMRSNQKAGIENVHTMLRMIIPKGTSFEPYTQKDIRLAMNHVNSAPRENLAGRTPYSLSLEKYGPKVLGAMQLKFIPADDVILSPKLLKYNH